MYSWANKPVDEEKLQIIRGAAAIRMEGGNPAQETRDSMIRQSHVSAAQAPKKTPFCQLVNRENNLRNLVLMTIAALSINLNYYTISFLAV